MPVLKTQRDTRKINLISDPEAYIEVYSKQNYGDSLAINKAMMGEGIDADQLGKTKIKVDVSAFMLATLERMIVGWNYTDEANVPLQVTRENICILDSADATLVYNEVTGDSGLPQGEEDQKKGKNS